LQLFGIIESLTIDSTLVHRFSNTYIIRKIITAYDVNIILKSHGIL